MTGDASTFKKLLASDPSLVNTREPVMDDPMLVYAARKNQPGMLSLLLKAGADIHTTNRLGSNALHLAAFTGDYALMELLINSGADWKVRNLRGKIPVDYVSFGKNPKVFDYLRNNPDSASPSLLNGIINPGELKGKKVIVLVSHQHTDHYDTTIWSWRSGDCGSGKHSRHTPLFISEYANPFHESTFFSFKLENPCDVTLTVSDLYGIQVATLIDEERMCAGKLHGIKFIGHRAGRVVRYFFGTIFRQSLHLVFDVVT